MREVVVAVDAMGGDRAPDEIVAGALAAAEELDVGIVLVGQEEAVTAVLPDPRPPRVELLNASEVIGMHDDPAAGVRRKKDSSLVRCAEAVRDGRAHAMVSAGNTGATMGAALLRMGRIKGVARPAIAAPIPVPGGTPTVFLDAGATVDCSPEWLVQFARMGAEYARIRYGIDAPRVGLLSNGEEPGKGDELRKQAHPLFEAHVPGFLGNVEGRDVMTDAVDVVVTDGFTGNVALKAFEGSLKMFVNLVFGVLGSSDEAKQAAEVITPALLEAAADLDPDSTGGAMLLGVDGVCVISHGSSSARAIVNAVRVAADSVDAGIVGRLREALGKETRPMEASADAG
ncbi:MAG TPA: phosphate acyltransferase PlsX [Acidimicrobiia bacterium]|nr:phosphate acyltransferase PlsX [Acidimicrobiia bacterium]